MSIEKGWEIIDLLSIEGVIHASPINDTKEHTLSNWCWCSPLLTAETSDGVVLLHQAADGREHQEDDHNRQDCRVCIDRRIAVIQARQRAEAAHD